MKTKLFLGYVSMLLVTAIVALSLAEEPQKKPAAPSIEGTYKLISRKLPDGTVLSPPQVMGLATFTKSYWNFNIISKDAQGKFYSFSKVSTYKLTATEYSETILFSIMNDQIGGKEISYDLSGQTRSAPVKVEGGRIEFKPPFDPPTVIYAGNKMTATAEGMFVDSWEKVQ